MSTWVQIEFKAPMLTIYELYKSNFIWILCVASIAITAISLLLDIFFLFLFFPIIFPLAFRRRFHLRRKANFSGSHLPEQDSRKHDDYEDWKAK